MKFLAKLYFLDFQLTRDRNRAISDIMFISLYLLLYVLQLKVTIILSYVVAIIYVYLKGIKIPRSLFHIYSLVVLLFLYPAISFNHGITPLFHLIFLPVVLLVAYNFSKKKIYDLYQIFRAFQYQNIILITIGLIKHYDELDPISSILPWASRNGITSVLVVCQITYCFVSYLHKKKFPFLSSFLVVILCFYGLGRGSIIVSVLLLLFAVILNIINLKSLKFKLFALIFIFGLISYSAISNSETIEMLENIEEGLNRTQFGQGYTDEPRILMRDEYLSNLNIWKVLFGSSYENTAIEKYFGGNPHNSYIRLHSFYGIFGLMVLFAIIVSILIANRDRSIKIIFVGLLILLLFRAYTEPILFPSSLDFFFLFMVLLYFRKNYFIPDDKNLKYK